MNRKIILTAALLGAISIVLGAFGAHALKKIIDVNALATFETGVRYQMYHALFLLFLATNNMIQEKQKKQYIYWSSLVFYFFQVLFIYWQQML